jgi:arsenate reductase
MAAMSEWGWPIILAVLAMAEAPKEKFREVVFVCEHGTVKSVIAAELFNRLAAERKVALHAVSRGVTPDDGIPPGVARNLADDGFDVRTFRPTPLREEDVKNAARVIAIGAESPLLATAQPIRWDDIPPASTDYAASRDAMRERMGALIDGLAKKK